MKKSMVFEEKPSGFPTTQVKGGQLKPLTQVLLDRRATQHFRPDPIPEKHLEAILRFAAQAPSGYNLQPARFIVVREPENKKRLQKAAFDQPKVGEASAVVVAYAIKGGWRDCIDSVFQESERRGVLPSDIAKKVKTNATQFMEMTQQDIWVNRHTMIAVTTMMLVAEAYGLDTAPMEGFDAAAVKKELGLPDNAEVVALLALGFAREPDKIYGGRFALSEIVHEERCGHPWAGEDHGSFSPDGDTQKETTIKEEPEPMHARIKEPLNVSNELEKASGSKAATKEPECPGCHMAKNEWPGEGYTHEGQTYCCQGCAEGTGCTCKKVEKPGFSREGQKATKAKSRPGEQRAGAPAPQGELSGERDAQGTEEAIDQEGYSGAISKK